QHILKLSCYKDNFLTNINIFARSLMKLLLWFGLCLKPLLAADDTPTHHTGVFTLEINLKKQKNIGNEFISIVENHVKLDILYSL
ncbi:hypothetical protein, partial [uncultured Microscilla sp.]|uniref:hypothetical protein n=1 Tax=uncultured Microscilla sp. TaxID=432653 RepID=UPI0026250258